MGEDPVHDNVFEVATLILQATNSRVLLDAPKAIPTPWGFTVRSVGSGSNDCGEIFDGLVLEVDGDAYLVWIENSPPNRVWVGMSEGGERWPLLDSINRAYSARDRDNQMDRLFDPPTAPSQP